MSRKRPEGQISWRKAQRHLEVGLVCPLKHTAPNHMNNRGARDYIKFRKRAGRLTLDYFNEERNEWRASYFKSANHAMRNWSMGPDARWYTPEHFDLWEV